jgi:uncharacterized protein DUF4082/PEP-CTERM motif-containing protein
MVLLVNNNRRNYCKRLLSRKSRTGPLMNRILKTVSAAILMAGVAMVASTGFANAGPAITLTTPGTEYGGGQYTLGFEFQVASNQTITQLGVYDSGQDGLTTGAQIGLWDTSGTLLRSVTIPTGTGSTLIGDFRYGSITPFLAVTGTDYIVGAFTQDLATSLFTGQGGTGTVDPNIILVEDQYSNFNDAFSFPNTTDHTAGAWLGGNFIFGATAVPEPLTLSIFGAGFVGAVAMRRRKKAQQA